MDRDLPHSGDPLLQRALVAAEQAWRRGDLRDAQLLLELALRRARWRNDPAGMLSAGQLLGHVAYAAGDLEGACVYHLEVLGRSRALGLALGEASALHNLGLVAAAQGEPALAYELITAAATHYAALGHDQGTANAHANLERLATQWAQASGGDDERG